MDVGLRHCGRRGLARAGAPRLWPRPIPLALLALAKLVELSSVASNLLVPYALTPPLVPLTPVTPLPLVVVADARAAAALVVGALAVDALVPLTPLVLLVRAVPLAPGPTAAAASLLRSSSARLRSASAFRLSSSSARLSRAACFKRSSFSISLRSSLAPCQLGFRINRWLCSVWLRIRVQVLSKVEAVLTVCDTVPMLPLARSRVPITPSSSSLMFRTPWSSRSRASSRVAGSDELDRGSVRGGGPVGVFGVLGVFGRSWCAVGFTGEKSSSEESKSDMMYGRYVWGRRR